MIISLPRLLRVLKRTILFFVFTVFFYVCIDFLRERVQPEQQPQEKVVISTNGYVRDAVQEEGYSFGERLKRFYWYGE